MTPKGMLACGVLKAVAGIQPEQLLQRPLSHGPVTIGGAFERRIVKGH